MFWYISRYACVMAMVAAVGLLDSATTNAFLVVVTTPSLSSLSSPSSVTRRRTTRIFSEKQQSLPNIEAMKSNEMKQELESYGISTEAMLEESDFMNFLKKARADGLKPMTPNETLDNEKNKAESETEPVDGKQKEVETIASDQKEVDSSTSRAERYQKAFDEGKAMKVKELKDALNSRGISTTTMLEKTEFVKAYADAMADNMAKVESSSSSSSTRSAASSSSAKTAKQKKAEEPMDPSYRDVVTQKFDRQRLMGQSVIDVNTK